jgi:hypothetical protein
LALLLAACSGGGPMPMPDAGCGAALTPPNLLADGSFECGAGTEWAAQYGDFVVVSGGHASDHAAQLTVGSDAQGQLGYESAVVASTSGKSYCVHACVKGTVTAVRIEVIPTMSGVAQAFSSPVTSDWVRAPPSTNLKVDAAAGDSLYLRFRVQNGQAGQTLLVDDVDFWESTSGRCDER